MSERLLPKRVVLVCIVQAFVLSACVWPVYAVEAEVETAPPPLADPADPGSMSQVLTLKPEDEKLFRTQFEKLAEADFESREDIAQQLAARGVVVLPLAGEFARHKDPEVAQLAASLRGRILLQYDGFVPQDESVLRALERPLELKLEDGETALGLLQRVARMLNITLLFDQRHKPADFKLPREALLRAASAGDAIQQIARVCGLEAVVRGQVLLLTSPEVTRKLERQRHSFEWKDLGLDREEAARLGEALQRFFPAVVTELHTGSEALSVRGPLGCVPKAARIVAALRPGKQRVQWPAPDARLNAEDTRKMLETPVRVNLNRDDLAYALGDFRKAGLEVAAAAPGARAIAPPYPQAFMGLAPVTISLDGMPLGLTMRWLARRAAFPGAEAASFALFAETDAYGRPQLRVGAKGRDLLALSVGGTDASFLVPADAAPAVGDAAAQQAVLSALQPWLELFPDCDPARDVKVLRGRLLVQGTPATVAATLDLVDRWHAVGKPPTCAWHAGLQERLDEVRDWDGRGLTAGKLLRKLRELAQCPVLLEDSEEGEAAHFRLKNEDAQLLAPGKYPLRKLFDDLAARAGATWDVRWGAVVLSPAKKSVRAATQIPQPAAPAP